MELSNPDGAKFPKWTAANFFKQGFLETGLQLEFEPRTILGSSYSSDTELLTLILNAPFFHAEVGQQMQLVPGCDGTLKTCDTIFNNYLNNGSKPGVPEVNPALSSVSSSVSQGGKGK